MQSKRDAGAAGRAAAGRGGEARAQLVAPSLAAYLAGSAVRPLAHRTCVSQVGRGQQGRCARRVWVRASGDGARLEAQGGRTRVGTCENTRGARYSSRARRALPPRAWTARMAFHSLRAHGARHKGMARSARTLWSRSRTGDDARVPGCRGILRASSPSHGAAPR
jgi:hypothetical protein